MSETVYLVIGYDVGGNSGTEVVRAFAVEADAQHYAENAKERKHNLTFWGSSAGNPFEVEAVEVVRSLEDVADELK